MIAYVVLALSFLFEGTSSAQGRAAAQRRGRGAGARVLRHLKITNDPTAKTVAFEDTAALIGIVLAAVGITLHHLTGQGFWDGLASVLIGLLLVVVAYSLGQQNKRALIGEALPQAAQEAIRDTIVDSPGVDSLVEMLTMRMSARGGPGRRVELDDSFTVDELEKASEEVERRVREAHPEVRHVFLDPTDDPDEA